MKRYAKNATDPGPYAEEQMGLFERESPCLHNRREKYLPGDGLIKEEMVCLDCGETVWHLLFYPPQKR